MQVTQDLSFVREKHGPALVDPFGRAITYLRVSVTDRCDFRCVYCMSEHMEFLPKKEILSFEEIETIVSAFVARGVRKVRLTGGEPLVRRDIMQLVESIGGHIGGGLEELTIEERIHVGLGGDALERGFVEACLLIHAEPMEYGEDALGGDRAAGEAPIAINRPPCMKRSATDRQSRARRSASRAKNRVFARVLRSAKSVSPPSVAT